MKFNLCAMAMIVCCPESGTNISLTFTFRRFPCFQHIIHPSICSIDPCLPNSLLYTSSLHFLLNEPQTHNRAEIQVLQLPCIIQVYTAIVYWTHKSTQKIHPLPLTESTSHNPLYSTHVAVQWSVDPKVLHSLWLIKGNKKKGNAQSRRYQRQATRINCDYTRLVL